MKKLEKLIEGITKPISITFVTKRINSARSSIVGNNITPSNLAKALQKSLKPLGVEVTYEFVTKLLAGEMSANAFYDQEADLEGDPAIEVQLLLSTKDKKGLKLNDEGFDILVKELTKVVVHEMLHKAQAIKRSFVKPKPFKVSGSQDPKIAQAQEYLGKSDEIEAYGHNIAMDLLKNYGSRKSALTALKNFIKIPPQKSPDLYAYLIAFNMDKNSTVIKNLIKKVVLYLKTIDEAITVPIKIGDMVLGGKFKNKKMEVKKIGKNEKGDITINDKPLLKFRIVKDA